MNTTTNETTTQNAVKVSKSSAECAAYNQANADAIALGLLQAQAPDDRTLAREAAVVKEREERERRQHEERTALAVLAQVNPTGVRLGFEAVYSGSTRWSSGYHSGWRLNIGSGYGADANKKWMVVGEGTKLTVTPKQLVKAREKIAEVAAVEAAEAARRNAKQTVQERTEAFIRDNPDFCKLVGHATYNSGETLWYGSGYNKRVSYQTAFLVNEDGSVKIGGEVFTVEQWTEIHNLRAAQAEAMKALKESFKASTN